MTAEPPDWRDREPTPQPLALKSNEGLGPVPEGCTPADAAMLRQANHALASDVHLLQTALADLYEQIHEFAATHGEADFYTGAALAVLAKTGPLEWRWPFSQPMADDAIAKLLAKRGA